MFDEQSTHRSNEIKVFRKLSIRAICQKVVYLLFKLRQCLKYCLSVNWYARSMFKFKLCLTSLKHPQKVRQPRGYV